MDDSLQVGLTFEFQYKVPENKTVPYLFPDLPTGEQMPKVFATGFMVGLIEHACIKAINPYINWPDEQSVGTNINVSHLAATPPGFTVTVRGKLEKVAGRRLSFSIEVHDGVDKISEGTHERYIIKAEKFREAVAEKAIKHK